MNNSDTQKAGLPAETIMSLSDSTRKLYDTMYDYCTYAADPQYQVLHMFRSLISRIANPSERNIMINYFNHDPAIRWNGIPHAPYQYYKKPY